MQAAEHRVGVDVENGVGGLARIESKQYGDQPADDMSVTVADEAQARDAVVLANGRGEPDLAYAALHLVGGAAFLLGQRLQLPAELDHVAITVLPILEEFEIGNDL